MAIDDSLTAAICGLPSAHGGTVTQAALDVFEACVGGGAPPAGADCTVALGSVMAATGCTGCLEELQEEERRSAQFCAGTDRRDCAAQAAPCSAAPSGSSALTSGNGARCSSEAGWPLHAVTLPGCALRFGAVRAPAQ